MAIASDLLGFMWSYVTPGFGTVSAVSPAQRALATMRHTPSTMHTLCLFLNPVEISNSFKRSAVVSCDKNKYPVKDTQKECLKANHNRNGCIVRHLLGTVSHPRGGPTNILDLQISSCNNYFTLFKSNYVIQVCSTMQDVASDHLFGGLQQVCENPTTPVWV